MYKVCSIHPVIPAMPTTGAVHQLHHAKHRCAQAHSSALMLRPALYPTSKRLYRYNRYQWT